jgi:hypothetical protein
MTATINRLWLAFIVPAILIAAIGATVALAQGDDSPTTDTNDSPTLLQEEPTPTPDDAAPEDDGSEDDGAEGDRTDKDCPRDGEGGSEGDTEGEGSTTGLSFRRR